MLKLHSVIPAILIICLLAPIWPSLAQAVETFGYIFVAVVAIWQHQIIDLVSPPRVRVEAYDHPPEEVVGDAYTKCIHGKIWSLNDDRPLANVRIYISSVRLDNLPIRPFPVPYQFSWAPAQNDETARTVGKHFEIFDIGVFYKRPSGPTFFRMDYRRHQDALRFDSATKAVSIVFFVRADNLTEDHYMLFEGNVTEGLDFEWTVKEYGTPHFCC